MSKSRGRVLSWIILLVFSLVIFSSSLFIITHADHDCKGEVCSVCMELAECHKTLHTLGTAVARAIQLMVMLFTVVAVIREIIKTWSGHTTLISLKVELLN